jgi:hypothetical protein
MGKKHRLTLFASMVLIAIVAILCKVATMAMVPRPRTSPVEKIGYSFMREGDMVFICQDTYLPDGNQIYNIIGEFKGERALERAQAWASEKYNSLPNIIRITPEEVKAYNSNPMHSRVRGSMTSFGP